MEGSEKKDVDAQLLDSRGCAVRRRGAVRAGVGRGRGARGNRAAGGRRCALPAVRARAADPRGRSAWWTRASIPTPDTTPILAGSHALSPNTNTEDELAALNPPLPGGHPDGHGTYMAMIAAAPANGWGMVGLAPTSVRIFNLKALAAGQTTFAFSEYASAIECLPGPHRDYAGERREPQPRVRDTAHRRRTRRSWRTTYAQRTKHGLERCCGGRQRRRSGAGARRSCRECSVSAPPTRTPRTSARCAPSATAALVLPCSLRVAAARPNPAAGERHRNRVLRRWRRPRGRKARARPRRSSPPRRRACAPTRRRSPTPRHRGASPRRSPTAATSTSPPPSTRAASGRSSARGWPPTGRQTAPRP